MTSIPATQQAEVPLDPPSPLDEFVLLISDLPYTPEPNVHPPVVKIRYSDNFDKVLSVYRAMVTIRNANGGSLLSPVFRRNAGLSRWLLTLGYVLTRCPAHYTVWKERRDLMFPLSSTKTTELEIQHDNNVAPPLLSDCCRESFISPNNNSNQEFASLAPDLKEILSYWTPSIDELVSSSGIVSVWRCVAWELKLVAQSFAKDFHKNFQLWHHRRELIERALLTVPQESRASVGALTSFLQREHHESLTFSTFDERIIAQYILKEVDSKNYHVWSHYMNMLLVFPFLLCPFPQNALHEAVGEAMGSEVSTTLNNDVYRRFWRNDKTFTSRNVGVLQVRQVKDVFQTDALRTHPVTLSGSAICSEMAFTAQLINEDWFNNSAWSHRFAIFQRHCLRDSFLDSILNGSDDEVLATIRNLCVSEMVYALGWALAEPCNECPFVYLKGVADQYQMKALSFLCSVRQVNSPRELPWSDYLQSLELHLRALLFLTNDVVPVVSLVNRDSAEVIPRTKFLQNNLHQAAAAQFRILFDILEALWTGYYSEETKQEIMIGSPTSKVDSSDSIGLIDTFLATLNDSNVSSLVQSLASTDPSSGACADAESNDCSQGKMDSKKWFTVAQSLSVHFGCQLFHMDGIRAKYWRHELEAILFCSY